MSWDEKIDTLLGIEDAMAREDRTKYYWRKWDRCKDYVCADDVRSEE